MAAANETKAAPCENTDLATLRSELVGLYSKLQRPVYESTVSSDRPKKRAREVNEAAVELLEDLHRDVGTLLSVRKARSAVLQREVVYENARLQRDADPAVTNKIERLVRVVLAVCTLLRGPIHKHEFSTLEYTLDLRDGKEENASMLLSYRIEGKGQCYRVIRANGEVCRQSTAVVGNVLETDPCEWAELFL